MMFSSSQFDGRETLSQPTDSALSSAKGRETQGLVPVTVKQISEASQSGDEKSNFVINGVDVANVTVVGMVFDQAGRNTDIGFSIDDGTGRIGCRRWPVTNFDEVTFHFIDCIHKQSKSQLQGVTPTQPHPVDTSLSTSVRNGSNGYQTALSSQLSGQSSIDGVKSFVQLVLDYLQQPPSIGQEKGIHRDELSRQLKIPVEKIMESIRFLEEEGLISPTSMSFTTNQLNMFDILEDC